MTTEAEERRARFYQRMEAHAASNDDGADDATQSAKPQPLAQFLPYSLGTVAAPEFVLDGIVQAGVSVIAGTEGSGKTTALVPLIAKAAHLCRPDDPLRPRLRRRVIWITEDPQQVLRVLYALLRFGGTQCNEADFLDRFRVVEAVRSTGGDFLRVKATYEAMAEPAQRLDGTTHHAQPVIVCDTKSAVFNLENENDNAETSALVAILKQAFGLPMVIIGHLAKALARADVKQLSMRGAGSVQGDAHQTFFFSVDEQTKLRYLTLGKRRFETVIDEIEFHTESHQVVGLNPLGESVPLWVRHCTARAIRSEERKAEREQAQAAEQEAERVESQRRIRGELLDAADAAVQAGNPLSARDLRATVSGRAETVLEHLHALVSESWLVEVRIPSAYVLVNNSRRAFMVALTEAERGVFIATGQLPADKARVPPRWATPKPAKGATPVIPESASESEPEQPDEGEIPLVPNPVISLKENSTGTTGKAVSAFPSGPGSQAGQEPPGTTGYHREPPNAEAACT